MNKEITYEIPKWGVILLKIVTLIMVLGFFYAGWRWPQNQPTAFKYFFYVVSFLSLVALYRLNTWSYSVVFRATESGMFFPCPKLNECTSEFLFVSWHDIENIKTDTFISSAGGSTRGVSIEIKMSLKDRNQFFPELYLKEHHEWTTVGFTEAFFNKKKAVTELNQLKSVHT